MRAGSGGDEPGGGAGELREGQGEPSGTRRGLTQSQNVRD